MGIPARRHEHPGRRPATVPPHALERPRVLRHLRERERHRAARGRPGLGGRSPAPGSVDPVAALDHRPRRPGRARGLRRHRRRPSDRRVRRRPVELVRAPGAPPLLGSGGRGGRGHAGGVPHAARVSRHALRAAGPVHALRGRGALAKPGVRARRRAGFGAPVRLPDRRRGEDRPGTGGRDGRGTNDRRARPARPDRDQGEGASAAAGGRRALPGRSRRARAAARPRRRGAERQARRVRRAGRAARPLAGQAQLQGAGSQTRLSGEGRGFGAGERRRRRGRGARPRRDHRASHAFGGRDARTGGRRPRPGDLGGVGRRQRRLRSPSRSSSRSRPGSGWRGWPESSSGRSRTPARRPGWM